MQKRHAFNISLKQQGFGFCPGANATRHVKLRTRVQDRTCVYTLTRPMANGHWTEAEPKQQQALVPKFEG